MSSIYSYVHSSSTLIVSLNWPTIYFMIHLYAWIHLYSWARNNFKANVTWITHALAIKVIID